MAKVRVRVHGSGSFPGKIGEQNLLVNSFVPKTNSYYAIGQWTVSEPLVTGETYTLTGRIDLGEGKTGFSLYVGGVYTTEGRLGLDPETGIFRVTFRYIKVPTNPTIQLYVMPGSVNVESTLHWIKMERGAVGTGWSANPTDIATIISRLTALEAKLGITYEPPEIEGPDFDEPIDDPEILMGGGNSPV